MRCARLVREAALRIRSSARLAAVAVALCLVAAGTTGAVRAEQTAEPVKVDYEARPNFGRMVLTFPNLNLLPPHKVTSDSGVLVIQFDQPVDLNAEAAVVRLANYVLIVRTDPDSLGVRMALARSVKVNVMEAGPQLFVDFLPGTWKGEPPRLPDQVVADLAKKADEMAKAAAEAQRMIAETEKPIRLDVSAARAPTFSRLTFKWNVPFEVDFSRTDLGVDLKFNRVATPDITAIRTNPPPFINDITAEQGEGGVVVHILADTVADVRAYKDGDSYVVDVRGPDNPAAMTPLDRALQAAVAPLPAAPPGAKQAVSAGGADASAHGEPPAAADPAAPAHDEAPAAAAPAAPAPDEVPAAAVEHAAAASAQTDQSAPPPTEAVASEQPPTEAAAPEQPAPEQPAAAPPADAPARPVIIAAPDKPREDIAELPENAVARALVDGVIRVESERVGQAVHITFPYKKEVGAALFMRDNTLWMVFDDAAPIDAATLQDAFVGFARSIEPTTLDGAQLIRIEMTERFVSTLSPDGPKWVMTIGELVTDPTRPLSIGRQVHPDGRKSLDIPFGPVSRIHRLTDPQSGDAVVVVTGKGQARGLVKPHGFTEFDALASIHGIALVPKVDDLAVTSDGILVSITRPGGLAVSTFAEEKKATLFDLPAALGSSVARKAAFIDFGDARDLNPAGYWAGRHKLMTAITQAREMPERIDGWYKTATFALAEGLGPETTGVLDLIGKLAQEETASSRMTALRAGGEYFTYRPEQTLKLLDRREFDGSPDAAVWKAMALSDLGRHDEAAAEFAKGDPVIGSFPPVIQRRYALSHIASAIDLKDYTTARDLLARLDPTSLSIDERARLDLLNALARDAAGHAMDAVALLSNIVRERQGPVAAEATYRLVQLQRREGLITLDQAIDRLEQLAVSWRGDELELKTLRLLGQYAIERGNYRRAFEVMRVAEQVNPKSSTSRQMTEEMQSAFSQIFLDKKNSDLSPVQALSLYYDYRELTPSGRRGDAMVRKLADRLVDVDLLPQAASLLDYQVKNRLRGAARAQVAADLALVQLLDHRPDKALFTLSTTRQASLPVAIERQRRTVEAKALAESGNADGALEVLQPLDGVEIARLKADILWSADRYPEAGTSYERMLGARWTDSLPLSDSEQLAVLKAGIAYTLSGDRMSVDRLRSKYAQKMAPTANGSAFDAVTGPIVASGSDFQSIVKSIADADTMKTFLADYRKRYLDIEAADKPDMILPAEGAAAPKAPDSSAAAEAAGLPKAG
jgi:tetratricopeptide (TPR) repeat protein